MGAAHREKYFSSAKGAMLCLPNIQTPSELLKYKAVKGSETSTNVFSLSRIILPEQTRFNSHYAGKPFWETQMGSTGETQKMTPRNWETVNTWTVFKQWWPTGILWDKRLGYCLALLALKCMKIFVSNSGKAVCPGQFFSPSEEKGCDSAWWIPVRELSNWSVSTCHTFFP